MNKLTKEEIEEMKTILSKQVGQVRSDSSAFFDYTEVVKWLEQKKKQWKEEAVRNYLEGETEDALCLD